MSSRTKGNASAPASPASHIAGLDGIRGLAVLMVLYFHFRTSLGEQSFFEKALFHFGGIGWAGVDLFFVLSGFLITRILLATKDSDNYFSSFYMRRFLRIFPVYYGTLFVLFIAAGGFEPVRQMLPPSGDRFFYWAYLSNWSMLLKDANPSGVGHFWSLAVEEQFYLVWPLLVWKLDRKKLWVLVTILCCAAPLWRVLVTQLSWDPEWIYRNTLSRMDALLMGAAGAILSSAGAASRLRQLPKVFIGAVVAFVALLAAIRTVHYWQAGMQVIGYSLLALIFTGLVLSVSPTPIQSAHLTTLFRNPALRRVGKYSYGMYVFHIPVQILCKPYLERLTAMHLGILAVLVLFAITFAIAVLSYELFESRILALKGRFEPKYAKPAAVAAG